jgi:hypothetical protein
MMLYLIKTGSWLSETIKEKEDKKTNHKTRKQEWNNKKIQELTLMLKKKSKVIIFII